MKFDILMLLLLVYGIIFCTAAAGGAQLHHDYPDLNITEYSEAKLDEQNSSALYEKMEMGYEGRTKEFVHSTTTFFTDTSHLTFLSGMEFGFENAWVGPYPFAILALILTLIYALQGHFDWLLIPVAILIIMKEFAVEKFARWDHGAQR